MLEKCAKKLQGYEYLEEQKEPDFNQFNQDASMTLFTTLLFLFGLIVLLCSTFIFVNFSNQNIPKPKTIIIPQPPKDNLTIYLKTYPSFNLQERTNDINDIFKARRLYINENNVTNDYIEFIRPINKKEEAQYNQILYKNILYNDYPNAQRQGQMNPNDFYRLCNQDKLINTKQIEPSEEPSISIIIPVTSEKPNLIITMNSIQNQTFTNIEIIIVDDFSQQNAEFFEQIYEKEPRLRLFKHSKKMGLWRTRMDGILYSRGKYILSINPGDMLSDNFVLEDYYRLSLQYNIDTVRFSFLGPKSFDYMKVYPSRHTKIIYGRPDYDVNEFGYGTIWNRLIRANLFTKALNLIDVHILNAYKDMWEDRWWNDLIDRVSFSNLILNKIGYITFKDGNELNEGNIADYVDKDRIIREFIYNWYFDYQLLPHDDNKSVIMDKLHGYNLKNNAYNNLPINLDFLQTFFPAYKQFLIVLFKDPFISNEEKVFIKELYTKAPKNK